MKSKKSNSLFYLRKYSDVFAQTSSDFGRTSKLEHEIHTDNSTPVRQALCRLSPHHRQEVQKLLLTILNEEVVQPSKSPWALPI